MVIIKERDCDRDRKYHLLMCHGLVWLESGFGQKDRNDRIRSGLNRTEHGNFRKKRRAAR